MITFQWNNYSFYIMDLGRGTFKKDMVGHTHSKNSYELHYITGGEGTLTTKDRKYVLSKGDFFVTGPNVYHQQTTCLEDPLEEIFVYLQIGEEKTEDVLVSTFLSTPFFFDMIPELESHFNALLDEYTQKKFGYASATSAIMQLLLTYITRAYTPNINEITELHEDLNDQRFVLIEREFIYNSSNVTLSSLAEKIGLSERQAQRLMHKYYGKSFLEKKAEAKIAVESSLLLSN